MIRFLSAIFAIGFVAFATIFPRHPENPVDDPLFARFPLTSSYNSPYGPLKVPFHVYEGDTLILACKANATSVQSVLDKGNYVLRTEQDEAVAFLWVVKYSSKTIRNFFLTE